MSCSFAIIVSPNSCPSDGGVSTSARNGRKQQQTANHVLLQVSTDEPERVTTRKSTKRKRQQCLSFEQIWPKKKQFVGKSNLSKRKGVGEMSDSLLRHLREFSCQPATSEKFLPDSCNHESSSDNSSNTLTFRKIDLKWHLDRQVRPSRTCLMARALFCKTFVLINLFMPDCHRKNSRAPISSLFTRGNIDHHRKYSSHKSNLFVLKRK